jgi:site-specific DNA-methyltransferase (adenine-specific)
VSDPWWSDDLVTVYAGDCLDVLKTLDDNSIDAVVTDPPYGLEFMGKDWDKFATGRGTKYAKGGELDLAAMAAQSGKGGAGPSYVNRPAKRCAACGKQAWSGSPCKCDEPQWVMDNSPLHAFQSWCLDWAVECLRVLKPGGHMLAFGGTRTWHRLAVAVEDAGFEIRDSIAWMYGSGFPKSLNIAKAIDRAAGELEPEGVGFTVAGYSHNDKLLTTAPAQGYIPPEPVTDDAKRWQGWGTALKPSFEPIIVARKPLSGTVAQNVLEHGTGALNIDATRVGEPDGFGGGAKGSSGFVEGYEADGFIASKKGRWPANAVLDESQAEQLDRQSGVSASATQPRRRTSGGSELGQGSGWNPHNNVPTESVEYGDIGGASRFFYTAKANRDERPREGEVAHPTVKPVALMRWLVRLVTPPGGLVLDPFAGSGTTGEACILEGFRATLIERETDYLPLIRKRMVKPMQQGLFTD